MTTTGIRLFIPLDLNDLDTVALVSKRVQALRRQLGEPLGSSIEVSFDGGVEVLDKLQPGGVPTPRHIVRPARPLPIAGITEVDMADAGKIETPGQRRVETCDHIWVDRGGGPLVCENCGARA